MRIVKERAIEMHSTARIYLHTDTHHTEVRRLRAFSLSSFLVCLTKREGE